MRAIIARSRDGAEAFAAALARRGVESVAAPVLRIAPRPDPSIDTALAGAQAVLLTSANGARALADNTPNRRIRIVAVGDATAAAARAAGFGDVRSVDGDAAALAAFAAARLDPADGPLVHAAGAHVAGDLAVALRRRGFACERRALYEAVAAAALPADAAAALRAGAVRVALFSPRGAAIFVRLARRAGLAARLSRAEAVCLARSVADAAGSAPWRRVRVAAAPRAGAMLDLLAADCVSEAGRVG